MKTLSFKVTDQEARFIRGNARRQHVTISEYLRLRAAAPAPVVGKPQLVRCPVSGAMIFDVAKGLQPLTVGSTQEMLADFP